MKKHPIVLLLLLAVLIAVSLFTFVGCSISNPSESMGESTTDHAATDNLNTENELEYALNDDGQSYSVCGIGGCPDAAVVIPAIYKRLPVTSIQSEAFLGCSQLTSVEIPSSITSIGSSAFANCKNLAFTTYDNAKYLGNPDNPCYALIEFANSDATSCVISPSAKLISDSAFRNCIKLADLSIPDGVTYIGNSTFRSCISLTALTIPDSVLSIGSSAFRLCTSLTSISIPDSVESIGECAFYHCVNLQSVTLGAGLTNIGDQVFYRCTDLEHITIPSSVTTIGAYAFEGCSRLSNIVIPQSVTGIGYRAFYNCQNLALVDYAGTASAWGNVSLGRSWNVSAPFTAVRCTEGNVTVS